MFNSVKRVIFNPLLAKKDQVLEFLKSSNAPNGTAHPFQGHLLLVNGSEISDIDVSDKPEKFFSDSVNYSEVSEKLLERIRIHSRNLSAIAEYDVITLTEPVIEIPFVQDELLLFALSELIPTYYDFCLGTVNGLRHSGDINVEGVLLHEVRINSLELALNEPFVAFVSGYCNNALHMYEKQRPSVVIVNHQTKSLYLVPVPLDQATIGNSTICCPIVGQRIKNDVIRFVWLQNPPSMPGVFASGGTLLPAIPTFTNAVELENIQVTNFHSDLNPSGSGTEHVVKDISYEIPDSSVNEKSSGSAEFKFDNKVTIITEINLATPSFCKPSLSIVFGTGLSVSLTDISTAEVNTNIVLPVCLGNVLEGPLLLAIGKPLSSGNDFSLSQLHKAYNSATCIIVTVSDRMSDQARLLNPDFRLNALFVISPHDPKRIPVTALDNNDAREEYLNCLNINAITALAGPQSVVVVKLLDNYFYYRYFLYNFSGIKWPGLFSSSAATPRFGEDVTDEILSIQEWIDSRHQSQSNFPWPFVTTLQNNQNIYYLGESMHIDKVFNLFETMPYSQVQDNKTAIRDVLTQLQILLDSESLARVTANLMALLKEKVNQVLKHVRSEFSEFVIANGGQKSIERSLESQRDYLKRKNTLHSNIKSLEKDVFDRLQWLIDDIGKMVSSRTSSNKQFGLKQLIRKNQTMANVEMSKSITYDQMTEMIQNSCKTFGVVMGNVKSDIFQAVLPHLKRDNFLSEIDSMQRLVLLEKPIMTFPTEEIEAILETAISVHKGPLASASSGTVSMAFPQSYSGNGVNDSSIAWPIFDEFVNLKNPSTVRWLDKAIESNIGVLRTLIRSSLVNNRAAQSLQIQASNPNVGYLMVTSLFDMIKEVVDTMPSIYPTKEDFEKIECQILRGLFGQLFTVLASGVNPLCMAFQIVQTNPQLKNPSDDEWFIYNRLVSLYPYTAWPMKDVVRNIKMLLVKFLRRGIADPLCEPMRKSVALLDRQKREQEIANKNQQLIFLKIAIHAIRYIQVVLSNDIEKSKEIAQTTLACKPIGIPETGGYAIVLNYLNNIQLSGTSSPGLRKQAMGACHDILSKRSALHKEVKTKIIEKLRQGDDSGAIELVSSALDRIEKVSGYFADSDPHDQGIEMLQRIVKSMSVSEKDRSHALGDAEQARVPWRVGVSDKEIDVVTMQDIEEMIKCAQTGELFKPLSSGVVSTSNVNTDNLSGGPYEFVIAALKPIPNSSKAVKLLQQLDTTTCNEFMQLAFHDNPNHAQKACHIKEIAKFVGLDNDASFAMKIREILALLLESWQNVVESEEKAIRVLN